jgi:hypothetical protein
MTEEQRYGLEHSISWHRGSGEHIGSTLKHLPVIKLHYLSCNSRVAVFAFRPRYGFPALLSFSKLSLVECKNNASTLNFR